MNKLVVDLLRQMLLEPGVNKHTHPGILSVEIRTRTSCGEKLSEGM